MGVPLCSFGGSFSAGVKSGAYAVLHLAALCDNALTSCPLGFVDCIHVFSVLHLMTLYQEGALVKRLYHLPDRRLPSSYPWM